MAEGVDSSIIQIDLPVLLRGFALPESTTESQYTGLVREIKAGNVIAFIGTGYSVPSGCPDWIRLLEKVANLLGAWSGSNELAKL